MPWTFVGYVKENVTVPDVLKPGIHGVRTHWIRGFMTFRLARRIRTWC